MCTTLMAPCRLLRPAELSVSRLSEEHVPFIGGDDEDGAVALVLGVAESNDCIQERYFHALAGVVPAPGALPPHRVGEVWGNHDHAFFSSARRMTIFRDST